MKTVKFVINGIIHVATGVVLVAILALGIMVVSGYRPNVVLSGSMDPEIKTGSICVIDTEVEYTELEEGDVIAFTNGQISVIHRIYEFRNGLIRTKGDANEKPDPYFISEDHYLGRYVGSVPYAGYVVSWLQSKRGIILTITAGTALILLEALMDQNDTKEQVNEQVKEEGGDV